MQGRIATKHLMRTVQEALDLLRIAVISAPNGIDHTTEGVDAFTILSRERSAGLCQPL